MDTLRQEILEAQRARSDLLKWKLVLVAGLSAVGLGFRSDGRPHPIVLVAIPLVCIYVDLLCRHLNIRIQLIAEFIKQNCGFSQGAGDQEALTVLCRYEQYVPRHPNAFVLEDWALEWSTVSLSVAVALYGVIGQMLEVASTPSTAVGIVLALSGVIGVLLSLVIGNIYQRERESIRQLSVVA